MSKSWQAVIQHEQEKGYFQTLTAQVAKLREQGKVIYPPQTAVFNALSLTPFDQVKVVILGQDPYHGERQAHGLAFSVLDGVKIPPSLKNIYKELLTDIEGFIMPSHGNLTHWAQQGVLLLNTVLTVEQGKAHSHAKLGWETFTDALITALNEHRESLVFILWGSHAQKKGKNIDSHKHLVLSGAHPSPLSAYRGFFGCQHFSKANAYLQGQGKETIEWQLPEAQLSLV